MFVEVKTMKSPSYKFLEKENLKLEAENDQLKKKITGMQKTIEKLKLRIGQMDKNMQKTIKAWNKDKYSIKKEKEDEPRDKYPWMTVGC